MHVKTVKYIKSFPSISQFDLTDLPSIAFLGRSNAGKSSLINHMISRKNLVKTSSTPGKTQMINYFLIHEQFYFVDLPGYGFSKVPPQVKKQLDWMIREFLFQAPSVKRILQIVDARHEPSREDCEFYHLSLETKHVVSVIANKADKLKKSQKSKALSRIRKTMKLNQAPLFHSVFDPQSRQTLWENFILPSLDLASSSDP